MVDIFEELKKDNPKIPLVDLRVFANALATYWEASENLRANGVVCSILEPARLWKIPI